MADHMLDVLGAGEPWEVPDEWLAGVRAQLRAWGDDAGALRPGAFPEFVAGTPAAVWFLHQIAPLLGGWIPVLRGPYADLSAVLTRDFHRAPLRFGGDGYLVRLATTDWPLLAIGGARGFNEAGRRQALQLSRDVVSLFVDAPPLAARAQALTAAFDRVLGDREVTRMHVLADYDTIAQFWQTAVLSDAERAVLPEVAGSASALRYSLDVLRDAHAKLSAAVPYDDAGDFAQILARLIRVTGLENQPLAVGQILGVAGWDVEHALADLRRGFDPTSWLARNTSWLATAIGAGESAAARSWAAAATRVSVHLAGVLENHPWPDPEVPNLAALFQHLDTGTTQRQPPPPPLTWDTNEHPPTKSQPTESTPAADPPAANARKHPSTDAPPSPHHAPSTPTATTPHQPPHPNRTPTTQTASTAHGDRASAAQTASAAQGGRASAAQTASAAHGERASTAQAASAGQGAFAAEGGRTSGADVSDPRADDARGVAHVVPEAVPDTSEGGDDNAVRADDSAVRAEAPADDGGPLAELEALIGLESVKESVRRMVAEIRTNQRRKEFGLPTQERARHMVFIGKPGTAKTTIARLLGRIYQQLGVLEKGHVVEVDRSDLVGSSVGTTAPMTAAKFREAIGGVLFVDEAYTLVPENIPGDFGHEAVATLLKMMEDYRDECVVIMAGYHREIQRLMESNTGLASRFPKLLSFSEYDTDQLVGIFELQAKQKGMIHSDEVLTVVRRIIPPAPRGHNFGNGRFIRNLLEEAISNQSTRLALRDPNTLTERDLRELLPEDIKTPASMRAEDYLLQRPGT